MNAQMDRQNCTCKYDKILCEYCKESINKFKGKNTIVVAYRAGYLAAITDTLDGKNFMELNPELQEQAEKYARKAS